LDQQNLFSSSSFSGDQDGPFHLSWSSSANRKGAWQNESATLKLVITFPLSCFLTCVLLQPAQKHFYFLITTDTSSKVVAFSWTLFLDRIPTHVNLVIRRVLNADAAVNCVFCYGMEETSTHLFLQCDFILKVSLKMLSWLQVNLVTPPNLFVHFQCWTNEVRSRKLRRSF
jgi:hypothetical protein